MPVFIPSLWLVQFLDSDFEFDWDEGNRYKSLIKHGQDASDIEECFDDLNLMLIGECVHPKFNERRFALVEKNKRRHLFIVFTTRQQKIRVISARIATKHEREVYEQQKED